MPSTPTTLSIIYQFLLFDTYRHFLVRYMPLQEISNTNSYVNIAMVFITEFDNHDIVVSLVWATLLVYSKDDAAQRG